MAGDYFEVEDVVKSYDSGIFRRILSYLKPYRKLVALIIIALMVSTVGELVLPIIQQKVIDEAVLARFLTIRLDKARAAAISTAAQAEIERLKAFPKSYIIDAYLFVPQNSKLRLPALVENELQDAGVIETEAWYVFTVENGADDPSYAVIEEHPDLFITSPLPPSSDYYAAAIKRSDLQALGTNVIAAVRHADISFIVRGALSLLVILIFVFICTFFQTWNSSLVGQYVMKDLRLALFKKTASQSTAFLSKHPVGRIVTRLTGDVETINEFFTSVLIAFLKDFSIMIGAFITLFILSPRLALVTALTLPPVLLIATISRTKARDAFRNQRIASSRVNAYISERLSGVQVVQLFHAEKKSSREFNERNAELLRANLSEMYVFAVFRPTVEWFSTFTTAVVIAVGSNMVLNLSLSLGSLIAFVNLISMFYFPVTDIAEKYTMLQSAMAGGERIFALLDTEEYIPDTGTKNLERRQTHGHIVFSDVHFSYKAGEEVLKALSFTVKPGEMAAIVGYTGAGKTTITNVLTRLWDIDSGTISLDGNPIQSIPLEQLRQAVLPVLQDVFLFAGTVADNIRLGLPLSDEQVMEAAKAVYADEFIRSLPEGYQTKLSEGAANISSGQRQLISFARVIAHNPAVVILDEATSSIDTETERLIQLGMQKVLAGRSSIVIAHRLSTIRHADRILVLSGGTIIEEGKHDELIARNGIYANLYRLQFGGD
ncbi:MAG: ABC transporter ATP-binding protein/permease [Spirochaetaceae bacterium]|jgi:ATP-binding cassette subfamily B protein|nr:ABC transporter ATP-binding protein/permease [Spirochaetaceae bacterium]